MKNNIRLVRINDEILREVSKILRSEIKDPRLQALASVTKVDTTNDLRYSKVFVSVMGDEKQKSDAMECLRDARNYVRKLIAERINLRFTPEFKFILDESLEYSFKISKLIDEIHKNEGDGDGKRGTDI